MVTVHGDTNGRDIQVRAVDEVHTKVDLAKGQPEATRFTTHADMMPPGSHPAMVLRTY